MVMINQVKLMNEENWVEIETTEMRNVTKKDEENRRIGKEIAGSEVEKKKKKKNRNEKQQQGKSQGILRKSSQWCNWDMKGKRRVREEKENEMKRRKKRKKVEIHEKEEQLMINLK